MGVSHGSMLLCFLWGFTREKCVIQSDQSQACYERWIAQNSSLDLNFPKKLRKNRPKMDILASRVLNFKSHGVEIQEIASGICCQVKGIV